MSWTRPEIRRTEALAGKQTNLDFGSVEPPSVLGRVIKLEPLPEIGDPSLAEVIGQRLAAMDVEIVHHQLNGAGKGIAANDPF